MRPKGATATMPSAINGGPASALPELFTLGEAAARLRMGASTLRGIARRREIGHTRSGKRLVFTASDLAEYLDRRRVGVGR